MKFLIENIENISNLDVQREYEKCINTLHDIGVPISVNTTLKIERHTLNKSQKTSKGGLTTRKNDGNEYIITIYLYGNETLDDIINVLYHELLHTIPGGMSHTGEWKAWADVLNRRLNVNIQRVRNAFSEEEYDNLKNNPRYKYSITCPKCGKEWHFTRETNAIRAIRAGSNRIRCPYDYEPLYISRAPGLKEAYHFGDLDYGKKSESSDALTGAGRGTGHFGTGFYAVSFYDENRTPKMYWDRGHWEIDLNKYKLFKPNNNELGHRLHDAFKLLDELDLRAFNNYNPKKLEYELDNLNYRYDNDGIIRFLKKYNPSIFNNESFKNDLKLGRWGAIEQDAKNFIDFIDSSNDELDAVINKLDSIFNLGEDKIKQILNIIINQKDSDSRGTRFMKKLGYEGVDVTHLNKDAGGQRGLDDFSIGSVVYDLKPNTYRKIR